jgi:CRISPR-associated protein Cas1
VRHIQNTLYVTQDGAYVHKDGESIVVHYERTKIGQFPMIAIGEIVCFGFGVGVSPALAEYCAGEGVTITYLNGNGRFMARLVGPLHGNVLLRRKQYRDADDETRALDIAKCCIAAKVTNQRNTLLRFLRNHTDSPEQAAIQSSIERMALQLRRIESCPQRESLRGIEGDAAETYFSVFDNLILVADDTFRFRSRNRRPPLDRTNALLSFAYSILALDMRSALESVGLDPYVGYLHVERPGRASLALDLAEEFRAPFADRLVLSLVNLRQIDTNGFVVQASGEVEMKPDTRKAFLGAYQKRKRETIRHPFLDEDMELGVAFLAQARLLARHIRGDLDFYPAFIWR